MIKAKDLTKAYKKLMIQPDKALDFIRKCDALHRSKVAAENYLSGANNFDNDESYSLIRIDQIDDIKPASPKETREMIMNDEMAEAASMAQGQQYGMTMPSHHYSEMPNYENELQLPFGEPMHASQRHMSNITMSEPGYGQPLTQEADSTHRRK